MVEFILILWIASRGSSLESIPNFRTEASCTKALEKILKKPYGQGEYVKPNGECIERDTIIQTPQTKPN